MSDNATLERPAAAPDVSPSPQVTEGEDHNTPTKPDVRTRVRDAITTAEEQRTVFEKPAEEAAAKPLPTFDSLIAAARKGWHELRDARLHALFGAVSCYLEALRFPNEWNVYRKDRGAKSRFPETQVFELMVAADPDSKNADAELDDSADIRARCGAMIAYFAKECLGMSAEEAVKKVNAAGGMVAVAKAFREANPAIALKADGTERRRPGPTPGSRNSTAAATTGAKPETASAEAKPEEAKEAVSPDAKPKASPAESVTAEAPPDAKPEKPEDAMRDSELSAELLAKLQAAGVGAYDPDALAPFNACLYLALRVDGMDKPALFALSMNRQELTLTADTIAAIHKASIAEEDAADAAA